MHLSNLFLGLGLVFVIWGVVSMMVITSLVATHGTKVNYFLFRLYIFKYISQYKRMTQDEYGKPGPWFYSFVISMNLTWVFAILGLLLRL